MAHMLENSGAAGVRFTPAELTELNSAVRAIEIRGQRLPDAVLVFSGVEAPPKKRGFANREHMTRKRDSDGAGRKCPRR